MENTMTFSNEAEEMHAGAGEALTEAEKQAILSGEHDSVPAICADIRKTLADIRAGVGMIPAWMSADECIAQLDAQIARLEAIKR